MEMPSLLDKLLGKPQAVFKEVIGKKIEFRILTNRERVSIWLTHPTANLMATPEVIAIPTLARAIISIDGYTWDQFKDVKEFLDVNKSKTLVEAVETYLSSSSIPYQIIMELYSSYVEVCDEYQTKLDELKKNSEKQSQEQFGESAKSSEKTP